MILVCLAKLFEILVFPTADFFFLQVKGFQRVLGLLSQWCKKLQPPFKVEPCSLSPPSFPYSCKNSKQITQQPSTTPFPPPSYEKQEQDSTSARPPTACALGKGQGEWRVPGAPLPPAWERGEGNEEPEEQQRWSYGLGGSGGQDQWLGRGRADLGAEAKITLPNVFRKVASTNTHTHTHRGQVAGGQKIKRQTKNPQ